MSLYLTLQSFAFALQLIDTTFAPPPAAKLLNGGPGKADFF
jgi:hypothetical protein